MPADVESRQKSSGGDGLVPLIAVVDDVGRGSRLIDAFQIAPQCYARRNADLVRFGRGDAAVGSPRLLGLDVLHDHQSEAGLEQRLAFGGRQIAIGMGLGAPYVTDGVA